MILLRVILISLTVTEYFAEEIVPVRTGSGPIPKPGGSRRKDPTADLPDLSREELLAILDLIEKSGDSPSPGATTAPPRYSSSTSKPLYPVIPAEGAQQPAAPTQKPHAGPPHLPTDAPFHGPADPRPDANPLIPPNYPAPIAPPLPASTTPKPKKSFFDKFIGGVLKLVSPQNAGGTTRATPGAFLNTFLAQLQDAHQGNTQQKNSSPTASAKVLNDLLQRLQGQNSEGSQFVTNLIQTLQANNGPVTTSGQSSTPSRSGTGEQLLSSLLKSVTQGGQKGGPQSGEPSFAELLQRQIFNRNSNSPTPTGQKTATDILFDGFGQVIQQAGRQ